MDLVEAWLESVRGALGNEAPLVGGVRVGVFYTAARLTSGETGVAFTPRGLADTVCCPRSAAAAPAAGRLAGRDAWELARDALAPGPLRRAVGVAVLNALSARAAERLGLAGARLLPGVDALDAAGAGPEDRVVLVGAFTPFIRALKGRVSSLAVVDRQCDALKDDGGALWHPPERAAEVLADATVVVVTASSLVEGGLDALLAATRAARRVVLAGPTTPAWPAPFFARGVDVLAGIRVLDGPGMLRVVGEGGSGYHFETLAEKVSLVRADDPGAPDLDHTRPGRARAILGAGSAQGGPT